MNDRDLHCFLDLALTLCGMTFDESKGYIIESRMARLLKDHGFSSYPELAHAIPRSERLSVDFIDAITNNETLFFRDESPFQALQYKVLPELIDARERMPNANRIRIWSAACSTGQEAYSIAMTICELLTDPRDWDIQILGSDLSQAAVAAAQRSCYSDLEIGRGLQPKLRDKYFTKTSDGWLVRDELRAMCRFECRNLFATNSDLGPFDIIFCRNVAIYFDAERRRSLFEGLKRFLAEDGYLFVGAAESLTDLGPSFQAHSHCRARFYRPNLPRSVGAI